MISELDHWWSGDLSVSNSGDLLLVSGTRRGEQRVYRRLMTNSADESANLPGDYLWDQGYGGSLGRGIGRPADGGRLNGTIQSTLTLEDAVARTPPPQVSVAPLAANPAGFSIAISYKDAPSNTPVVLSFDVTP